MSYLGTIEQRTDLDIAIGQELLINIDVRMAKKKALAGQAIDTKIEEDGHSGEVAANDRGWPPRFQAR